MTTSSILLVDKRIQDHETIVAAVKADGVRCIVFDVTDIDAQGASSSASSSASFEYILDKIADLGATSFSNIGIVQHNTGAPFHRFFAESQGEESTVAAVETADPTLQTWAGFAAFVTTLKNTYGVQNVDLMACALYSDPDWKYVIDTLAVQTGVTIRASTDDTGAAALGGDWFLESHTGVNLKDVYFTEAIEEYRGVLFYSNRYDSRTQQTAKSFAPGRAFGWGYSHYGGDTYNNITGGSLSSDIIAVYGNTYAMAALRTGGSVVTWGANSSGAAQQKWTSGAGSGNVAGSLTSGVTKLYMNSESMSALKTDGTVITWGHTSYGGDSSTVTLTNVVDIYSNRYAFAALKSNGSVVSWGNSSYGSDSSAVSSSISSDVVSVNMAYSAGAALKKNGSVITWGGATYGGNSSSVTSDLSSGIVVVYTDNEYSYAALNNNGRVITWGYSTTGYILSSSVNLTNTVSVFSNTSGGYAALKLDGSVVTWGNNAYGGNSTGKGLSTAKIVSIYGSASSAFAALTSTGNVITWGYGPTGGDSSAVSASLTNVVAIYSNSYAFAALKNNGQVITWGHATNGGTSTSVSNDISRNVVAVYSTQNAFAALRKDGKTIVWGDATAGGAFNVAIAGGGTRAVIGGDLNSGIVSINNSAFAFAAIQNTTATTFDLSASYYTDNDRYDILRNKENRRRANLTTLNNNVFTLSSARDIERFNYTIPTGAGPFRIIVPDFVDSSYSITSTASIPGGASINYIIACEEGEPVTISGTTYINYGAFVYRRNADNTFTKMPSVTIDGLTYNAYGGDGINSSGIALRYRFGAFAVPEKTAGDASFNLTAPVSDSSGAITYTSSNTNVATVTSGGEVTIVAAGTTTITATQAASGGSWPADSITASLVVSKLTSTLGELTVPAKIPGDAPFALTAPTSSISSIISPTHTITSTATVIVPPPDIWDVTYGTAWGQLGLDILGTQASENSGVSVSVSADGTVVAIGSYLYDKAGGTTNTATNEGRTRIYKYNGTAWTLLGSEILGTQASEYSGYSVSLSADGTTVAIGFYLYDKTGGTTNTNTNEGRTRIYKLIGTTWTLLGSDIIGTQLSETSGISVSLSADGTTVAIGSQYYDIVGVTNVGRTCVYKYNGTSWGQLGLEISGTQANEESGISVSLSADGTTVAIGSQVYDTMTGIDSREGRTRVYKYNNGTLSWGQLGLDISGTQMSEYSGYSVSLSADGNTVAIGSYYYDKAGGTTNTATNEGRTRIYKYNNGTSSWTLLGSEILGTQASEYSGLSVSLSADGNTVAIGSYAYDKVGGTAEAGTDEGRVRIYKLIGTSWGQLGLDISGTQVSEYSGTSVSLSADGNTVAIGSYTYDKVGGTTNANTNEGRVRVYKIATTNALTYSSSSSSIADVCGNLLLIKGVNGTSTITASQTGNTVTGRLDVSGTTYTLQYNPFTYTISDASLATVSTYGTVTLTGTAVGTSTVTATQPATRNYESRSVTGSLVVSKLTSTLGALTVPAKIPGDAPFALTAPTSSISSIISPVNTITSTASVIVPPPDIWDVSYGTAWEQLGLDISGTQVNENNGYSVSVSADGTVVAIGSFGYSVVGTNGEGRVRIYKYNGTSWNKLGLDISGTQVNEYCDSVSLSADGTTVAIGASNYDNTGGLADSGRVRIYKYNGTVWNQRGLDISGNQYGERNGISVSLSADGTTVAIGSHAYDIAGVQEGRTRVYKFNGTSWNQLGLDISGNQYDEQSGYSVSLSADGTTVAIGSRYYDKAGGATNTNTQEGRTRVYKYDNGTLSWGQLGLDISGNQVNEQSGWSVSLSADGTTVAIGSNYYDIAANANEGRTRIYRFNGTSWIQLGSDISGNQAGEDSGYSVSISSDGNMVAIGSRLYDKTTGTNSMEGRTRIYKYDNGTLSWGQLGLDISGNQANEQSGWSVSISSDGTTVAIGSYGYDTPTGNAGRVRVYKIATTNALTYSSSSSSIADVCGNLLLIKGVNGTSTITASQTGNTVTGRLDVSGTTYTLQYNPFTYTISDASLATVSTYGTVTLTGTAVGTSTVTATQPATRNYESRSVTGSLVVSKLTSTLGALTVPAKIPGDAPFALTAPTSTISSIISPTHTITSTATVIVPPPDIWDVTYGTTWMKRGADIDGELLSDLAGHSVALSADGTVVAIGAPYANNPAGTNNVGHVRVYKYNPNKLTEVTDQSSNSFGPVGWDRLGRDIDGEAASDQNGYSVALSADGTIVAIGAINANNSAGTVDVGHVRVYKYNPNKLTEVTDQSSNSFGPVGWTRLGRDIDGETASDFSGWSVALSADGTTVAIGAHKSYNLATTNFVGHVRVYKYNPNKDAEVTDQTSTSFGPVGWERMGRDIDGEASDYSGWSVALSADGTIVAIGAVYANNSAGTLDTGHVRVYKYNPNKLAEVTDQTSTSFGPVGWDRLGRDIDGEWGSDESGWSVALSADGTIVAIGARYANNPAGTNNVGHVRVYKYNPNKGAEVTDQTSTSFGPVGWDRLGRDIDGEALNDYSGWSVALSADGTIVAIGARDAMSPARTNREGHVRIYKYNPNKLTEVTDQSNNSFGPVGWTRLGIDIDGEAASDQSGYSVALSADGTTVAIGAPYANNPAGTVDVGHVRVYDISASNALTYSSSSSSIADVCGNLLLIKSVNGTSTITASQTGNTVTGRLDVSGTTYTLQYNPFTYTISDASLATVSTYGTVTLTGTAVGTSTVTATQPATRNYESRSVSGTLDVSGIVTVLGALTIPTKMFGDASFNITPPTSNKTSGAFTYTSSNTAVATITSNGVITIIGIGTTTITATQAASGLYTSASVSGYLVVNFGNTSSITRLPTDGAYVIPAPVSNVATTYGSLWNQLGADTVGKVSGDESGTSISVSADGTLVAIGARSNTTNRGTVRVYKYNDVIWNQIGSDINGEASSDYSGQSVSLSANGRILAIGANMNDGSGNLLADSGHVRIYEFNGTNWVQRGGDIDGEATADQSGFSVSLSADGATVAIGAIMNDGSGNALSNSGHVRVYRYNASKTVPQLTDQSLSTFGPAGWDRLGGDIDGEAINDQSGFSVSLSANGTIVAIGANFNDGTSGTVDTSNNRGHVRVYRYNASKTSPQLTDQTLSTFGPVGWDRMGSDIDGEVAADQSGFSVSLSSNGAVLAIGSPLYDVSGVSNSGRVRVFAWNGSSWAQRGQNINGITLNENVGDSVSLSADGSILSVASFMKVANYNYNSSTDIWSQIGANVPPSNNMSIYSPHVYLDATNTSSYNRTTNTWTNIGSLGGNVLMTNMGTFDAADNGGSFNFNGTTNRGRITVPSTTLTSLTYVAVVKTIGLNTSYATIVEFGNDTLLFSTFNNVLRLFPYTSTAFTLTPGIWYVVAVTVSGAALTYYVNGVSVFTTTGATLNITNTAYDIGSGINGNEYWSGKISALAIFHNRVLTASEIASVSNTFQTYRVSLSSQGNILAIGAREYDGANGTSTNVGVTRVYRIDTSGNYTFSSGNTAIADICGNILLPKSAVGSTTIGFTQSSSGATASRSGTIDFSVSYITPTIGALTAPAKNFGASAFDLTAPTSNSDGAFTYESSDAAVATVTSGGTVTVVGAGTTTITATQAASGNYATGAVTASLVVSAIAPTIGALTAPAKNFGASAFDLTAPTSNSGGAFTYESSDAAVATVTSGGRVTVVGAGTTTITASQASTTNYTSGSVTASLVVSAIAPTIGALTAPAKNFGASAFDLTAPTSNSDGAFTYASSDAAVATVTSGGTVTVVGAGTTTITASQASTTNYTGGSVTASLVVSAIAPTIGALTAPAKNFGDASFNLTAPSSNSDGAFTYTSSDAAVATVTSGGTVTVVGAGTTTITASQASTTNYTGGSVTASLVVSPIAPTYQSISQITKIYSTDVSFSLTSVMSGVSNSSGAYTFSTTSAAIDICGGVATILAYTPSAITITATQAASGNYNGAGSTTFAVLVNRKVPSYGAFSVPAATYEDAPFSIAAYAPTTDSAGVPFTYTSSEPTVATINSDGTVVTIIGQGYTTITASQAAGGNYAASSTTTSFLVNRAAPTFLKAFTIPNKTFGDASFSLLPFTEGLDNTDGTYHFTSSNAQLVSISEVDGVTATILAYTPTPITIYVAIDACGNYAASSTSGTLTVARAAPTIGALTVPAKNFGDASFNLTAPTSDSSGGAFTYTSSAPGVATVTSTGGTVTVVGAGSTTITATQAASGNYLGGSVTASLVVSPIAPTIGALSVPAKNFGDASFNLTAPTSNSGGAFTYTSSAPGVATVTSTGGTVTIVGAGSTTITATQAASADGNYTGGSSVTASLVVSASLSNFTVPTGKVYGDASFDLTDPSTIDNTVGFTFTSSDSAVATISGRTVTIVGAGSSVITASQAATENRAQMDISATLVVTRASVVITLANITKAYGDAQFRLAPTSTNTDAASGAAFSFTSNNTSVASIVDTSFVSIDGVGEATIAIAIAATANFTDGSGSVVVTVNKGTPTLSALTVTANKTYGSAPFSVLTAPTSASAGAITYSSSDTGVATIDNSGVITLLAAGYVNFTATQAATSLYNSATKTSNTMTVHRQSIFLNRTSPSVEVVNKTYGDGNFIVSATNAATGGAITYESDTPSVASVINASTGVISVVSVGTATITATRAQTAQYTSDPVSWTIQVARTTTTLTGLSNLTRNVTVAPFAVTASSASDGAVTYALQDPSSTVLTIHPTTGVITLRAPGSAVIVASQAQGTLYEAPNSITATITVNAVGNALQGATLTSTANFSNVNLNGANMNNANVVGSNFAGANLSGSTLTGATITGATFTNASLENANLSGATLTGTNFANADLSGATLTGANVANVNFTNTNIKGANITDVSFTPLQKLQLLKNSDNRDIAAIAVSSVSGPTILAAISESSPARTIANLDLSNAATSVAVFIPQTSTSPDGPITDVELDVDTNNKFYLPINEGEYFRISGVIYYTTSTVIRKYATNEIVEIIKYMGKSIWLFVGSIIGLVLQDNTLNASSFVVPTSKLSTDTEPFMPITLPTSNSNSPIVYSSSSPHLATINATTGEITITGNGNGLVTFTATQVQNATYAPGTITSNTLLIDQYLHFSLVGLNQSFNLTTLASLETLNLIADTTDATAVFYVRLSDMTDIFKYQSDSADVNDISATDLKYYVFHRKWPAELKINPSHAMLNKADSAGILGTAQLFAADKALVKHDFVRYLALKLFNTIHGVDLFVNETDLQENATYYGESIRHNIHEIMSGISTTSGDESMAYDASGNKYLTNSASTNTNLCRELMRHIAASVASRFYNNGADNAGMKTVPLREEDTITFKVTIQAAATQNVLTGVTEIPSRSYTIKLVLKSSVTSVTNANTVVSDSEMFPNSYPYSSSVTSIAPDSESAATVYNIYSPPAPIPFSRFGFNGWYYTNSSAWVGVNSGVRNHVKWLIPANRAGSSTVGALQYVRVNLKIYNKTAVPYLMVYTQSGSWRKYIVSGGGNSLVNGTKYSFYMNFNTYSREPAMIGYTNKDLVISLGTGAFAGNEVITNIALETDSGASAGAVEFTLASVMVGEIASGVPSEKEYGFLAEVPSAYP